VICVNLLMLGRAGVIISVAEEDEEEDEEDDEGEDGDDGL
jgi:hypothetical protein